MKRRLFVFFLLFAVAAPAFGWACDCCPTTVSEFSNESVLNSHHDCCEMLKTNQAGCAIEAKDKSLPASGRTAFPLISTLVEIAVEATDASPLHSVNLGPPVSSETPLYLSLRTLRL